MNLIIKNGHILDPATARDGIGDLYIQGDRISAPYDPALADRVIDAAGCYCMPGLVDLHVHLRDPGLTYKEDVETGSRAAAKGGVTTVVAMPNTKPVMDRPDRIDYVTNKAEALAPIRVIQTASVTVGQQGEALVDIDALADHGVLALSEDGKSVMNTQLMKEAMEACARRDILILDHCEDKDLVNGGCVNADDYTRGLGLPGICNAVEDTITARDILLSKETGCRLHLCHVSTGDAAEMLRQAKRAGLKVSGEVCPHHFTLTSEDIIPGDSNYKMNPPLRSRADKEALIEALRDGTFDVISTDHAPHAREEKGPDLKKAAFGIVGLETSAALTYTELVKTGVLTPLQMAEKMSCNPARILGIDKGTLREGAPADVMIFDPESSYEIDPSTFVSKGKNTPFGGRKVWGEVKMTICRGSVVYQA